MIGSKPNSLLSFVYNTTGTPAYRTEMHMDMRRAFQRFQVGNGTAQGACFEIERAAYDLRTSSSDAAAEVPVNGAKYDDADARMKEAPRVLFRELEDEIVAMVMNPTAFGSLATEIDRNGPSASGFQGFGPIALSADRKTVGVSNNGAATPIEAPTPFLLLDYVYYFFHFKEARAAIAGDPSGVERATLAIAQKSGATITTVDTAAVVELLKTLGAMMDAAPDSGVAEEMVRPRVRALCGLLATEYAGRGWRKCW